MEKRGKKTGVGSKRADKAKKGIRDGGAPASNYRLLSPAVQLSRAINQWGWKRREGG